MSINFTFKPKYDIDDLIYIVELLRSPEGCPWDREQDHQSIKKNFIEETYEVVEAINKAEPDLLCEELGDVMLQVALHAQMEREKGVFDFSDVADGVCKKLIERHPHVFGDITVSDTGEVLKNWDDIKRRTKKQKTTTESMISVPRELPALMRAEKLQQKAAKVGFDWDNVDGALSKLSEEVAELKSAVLAEDKENIAQELGDVLFSAVNVSRFYKLDAEESLTQASDKFLSRFSMVEKLSAMRGIDLKSADINMLDSLWDEAKEMV